MIASFTPSNINSLEDLTELLGKFPEIKPHKWLKSVTALYQEIKSGDCILGIEDGKLYRLVNLVAVRCFHTDSKGQRFQIYEEKQEFVNGPTRIRGFKHLAEKIQAGETPEQAALRGLAEELKISGPEINVTPLLDENTLERGETSSFKGLKCSYNCHVFACEIMNPHFKDTYTEVQPDKTTTFKWAKI